MTHARAVAIVAAWEFRRFFKWRDQVIGFVLAVVVGLGVGGATMVAKAKGRVRTVALAGIPLEAPAGGRIRFVTAPAGDSAQAAALRAGEVHGVLARRPDGGFDLKVDKDPRFRAELAALLGELVRRERLAAAGLRPADLERILAPAPLEVRFIDPDRQRAGRAEKIVAVVAMAGMLFVVFISLAYLLTGITSEKQLRVTELVVSAISPQAWIDGKILGITGYALVNVLNLALATLVLSAGALLTTRFRFPAAAARPEVLLALLLYSTLGLLLWNAFLAAVAAAVDDPNTSRWTMLLFVPLLPVIMSLAVLRDPDSGLARFLALFPATSAPAMPMRLVLSDPGAPTVALSLALLLAGVWLMRRFAGRIFAAGIMLTGKEPTFEELLRWAIRGR